MVINPIVGVYIPTIRIPSLKVGRSPIPNIATFDHGTYDVCSRGTSDWRKGAQQFCDAMVSQFMMRQCSDMVSGAG